MSKFLRSSLGRVLVLSGLLMAAAPGIHAQTADQSPPERRVERQDLAPPPDPMRREPVHALAMYGEPKYPVGFDHFDYVDPDAPKGGTLRLAESGTYDSFHPYIPKGTPASGTGLVYETLLTSSADEPFTEYGLLAESLEVPEDRSWIIFHIRPEARWHDGESVTAEDVAFSLEKLKTEGHPFYRFYYQNIVDAEIIDPLTIRFVFSEGENRELPLIAGQLPVLPKHWWADRDFTATHLDPPLGSGPYRISSFEPGRFVELSRVEDWWGADLAVNEGQYNFDRIRYDHFLDDSVIRQALKSGTIDYRLENQAKAWAVDYDVPAVQNGWLVKEAFEHDRPAGMQAFVMNSRRPPFDDWRVRRALAHAFDFPWTNRNLFFGQYKRTESYFANSELAATGLPSEEELEILEPLRGQIPEDVFNKVYEAPTTDGSGWPRENLARAFELLEEAGWVVRDMQLVNAETGRPFTFEIMLISPAFERIVLPFVRNLARLGITVNVRLVDTSQYINRMRDFDFDMVVASWGQSISPGNEQRDFWGSEAAERPGSRNYIGIEDPAIDRLIELLIASPDRESLVTRTRALDRALLHNHFVIPNWHTSADRILYWNKFGHPQVTPASGTSWTYWWLDEEKAHQLRERIAADPEALEASAEDETPEAAAAAGGGDDGPATLVKLLILAAAVLVLVILIRRALRRRPNRGARP